MTTKRADSSPPPYEAPLLLSVPDVQVTQIYEGESIPLAKGTLELTMVTVADQEDRYLVMKVADVEIALTPESQVFKKGESGYYVPWLELPGAMLLFDLNGSDREYMQTLDTYLVDFTSMPAPEQDLRNQLALVDENGEVVGEVAVDQMDGLKVPDLQRADSSKAPVIVDFQADGNLSVAQAAPEDSNIVRGGHYISTGILYGANAIATGLQKGSVWVNSRSAPTEKDVEFSAITKSGTRRIHQVSSGVGKISSKTVSAIAAVAEKAGGKVAGHGKPVDPKDPSKGNKKHGVLSQSAFALITVLEALDHGGKQIIGAASSSTSSVVKHRYGSQAGQIAEELGGSVKNVALVYFDVKGIGHRALLKSSIKGGVKARMSDGRQVVLTNEEVPEKSEKS